MARLTDRVHTNPALTDAKIKQIQKKPLTRVEELENEGATIYDYPQSITEKWFDTTPKSLAELKEHSEQKDEFRVLKPCIHTNFIRFKLSQPTGMSKECTCNSCWNTFYIGAFNEPTECPYCHERGVNIASKPSVSRK